MEAENDEGAGDLKEMGEKCEQLNIQCHVCSMIHTINVRPSDLQEYRNGAHAQRAFPYLTADERELIISGVCGKCFDNLFDGEDDED